MITFTVRPFHTRTRSTTSSTRVASNRGRTSSGSWIACGTQEQPHRPPARLHQKDEDQGMWGRHRGRDLLKRRDRAGRAMAIERRHQAQESGWSSPSDAARHLQAPTRARGVGQALGIRGTRVRSKLGSAARYGAPTSTSSGDGGHAPRYLILVSPENTTRVIPTSPTLSGAPSSVTHQRGGRRRSKRSEPAASLSTANGSRPDATDVHIWRTKHFAKNR